MKPDHFWCHECKDWTEVEEYNFVSDFYDKFGCAHCGDVYLCDYCGEQIDRMGNCLIGGKDCNG